MSRRRLVVPATAAHLNTETPVRHRVMHQEISTFASMRVHAHLPTLSCRRERSAIARHPLVQCGCPPSWPTKKPTSSEARPSFESQLGVRRLMMALARGSLGTCTDQSETHQVTYVFVRRPSGEERYPEKSSTSLILEYHSRQGTSDACHCSRTRSVNLRPELVSVSAYSSGRSASSESQSRS